MKNAVFTFLNYVPRQNIMPMHRSSDGGKDGDTAIFFGLSGTGKTTLSADPHRVLIGDDEYGWSKNGFFNFEGGCYDRTLQHGDAIGTHPIDLSSEVARVRSDPVPRLSGDDEIGRGNGLARQAMILVVVVKSGSI